MSRTETVWDATGAVTDKIDTLRDAVDRVPHENGWMRDETGTIGRSEGGNETVQNEPEHGRCGRDQKWYGTKRTR